MQFFNPFFKYDFDTFTGDATDCLVRDLKSLSNQMLIPFFPSKQSSSSRIIPPIVFYIFMNAPRLSSSSTPIIFFVDHNVWE